MSVVSVFPKSEDRFLESIYSKLTKVDLRADLGVYFDEMPAEYDNKRKTLVQFEPPAVLPIFYSNRILKVFDQVICMSPWRAERLGIKHWSFQPVIRPNISYAPSKQRTRSIVMINEHKFSAVDTARYSTRRLLVKKLQRSNLTLDLYGPQWNMNKSLEIRKRVTELKKVLLAGKRPDLREALGQLFSVYSSYKGVAQDKLSVMSDYKFALVIENDIDSLTEKLFDAIFAGTIPFYLGPPLERFTSMNEYCIQLPDDIDAAVEVINQNWNMDHFELSERINNFALDSNSMNFVSPNQVADSIVSTILSNLSI